MAGSLQPFAPSGTTLVAATVASGAVPLVGGGETVLVTNVGATVAFIAFGNDVSVVANVTACVPILPGDRLLLTIGSLVNFAAVIMGSGTANVLLTRGEGSFI